MSGALALAAAGLVLLRGVAHVIPTGRVVDGFGEISRDSRLVLTQEWVSEALAIWLVAALVVTVAVGRG